MASRRLISPALFPALVLASARLGADDAQSADPDLPQPFDAGVTRVLIENSPFTRAVNLAENLQLTGMAYLDGKPVITVKDTTTNKSHLVTMEPNTLGWRLESVVPGSQANSSRATIVVGSEVVTIHQVAMQITPARKSGGGGGSPGYMPSKIPTPEEFTGHDDKGAYVRGVPYLSDEDRAKFREVPREVREKFLEVVHDHRDRLFKASHEERASFVKKVFDSVTRR